MNGCGDIQIKNITQDEFSRKPQEVREWLMYSSVQSMAATCHSRPEECGKKFVKVRHVAIAAFGMICILIGLGIIQVQYFMPQLIKTAVATALAAM